MIERFRMRVANWDGSLATGHDEVDSQHKLLFGLINDLHDAIVRHQADAALSQGLLTLEDYIEKHFRAEEGLMRAAGYPEYDHHRHLHELLTFRTRAIVARYRSGEAQLPNSLSAFLREWLIHHIRREDTRMIEWVRAHLPVRSPGTS